MKTENSNIILDVSLIVDAKIILHEKGGESLFDPDDITNVWEENGKTILTWSYNNGEYEEDSEVDETIDEIKELIAKARDSVYEAYKKYEIVENK